MPILYIDNFRGFQKTFLPLKNVNFFVGENSTGKTSILKLIKLLSSRKFWFELQFDSVETDLGFYSEIVSKNSNDQSYFDVGIVGDLEDKNSRVSAFKLRFIESKGIPKVSEICMIQQNRSVVAKVKAGELSIAYDKIDTDNVTEANKLKYFKFWLDQLISHNMDFEVLELPSEEIDFPIIFFIKSYISNKIKDEEKKPEDFGNLNLPYFLDELAWLAPIRAEPQRTYDKHKISFSPDGTHAPYLLKELLNQSETKRKKVEKILNRFGQDSGLYKKILPESLRGDDETAPFEIHVYLNDKPIKISNVGYGVSQVLPLIIEIIRANKESWFAIQQPEIHLHPKSQAAFGELLFKSFQTEKKKFIVETHSDFTIDRFRLRVKKEYSRKRKEREFFQVVFFERKAGKNTLSTININNNGSYSASQPDSFKDFFIKEQLELLDL